MLIYKEVSQKQYKESIYQPNGVDHIRVYLRQSRRIPLLYRIDSVYIYQFLWSAIGLSLEFHIGIEGKKVATNADNWVEFPTLPDVEQSTRLGLFQGFQLYSISLLRCIVRDRLSINTSINSKGCIPKSSAICSRVPSTGEDLLLNHSDQFFLSTPVLCVNFPYDKDKNSSLLIGEFANITSKIQSSLIGFITNVTQTTRHPLPQVSCLYPPTRSGVQSELLMNIPQMAPFWVAAAAAWLLCAVAVQLSYGHSSDNTLQITGGDS